MPEELVGRLRDEGWTVESKCSMSQEDSYNKWRCEAKKGNQYAYISYRRPGMPDPNSGIEESSRKRTDIVKYHEAPLYREGEATLTVFKVIDGDEAQRLLDWLHPAQAPLRDFDIKAAHKTMSFGWFVSRIEEGSADGVRHKKLPYKFAAFSAISEGDEVSVEFSITKENPPDGPGVVRFRDGCLIRTVGTGDENRIRIDYENEKEAEMLVYRLARARVKDDNRP